MADEEIQYEIKVTNAFKNYGNNKIICGLNMCVASGSIYGLLGASGCGKSTLLQCILGTIMLDYGSINLKVNHLNEIGYMPQDLCLEDTLTIKEIFNYYGTLYSMTQKQIDSAVDKLVLFLQLPNMDKLIKNISGGQARRVSIAVSILHNPKVIILDEPTVGIDPLLRHEIWEEFAKMVQQENKTIIITTHYIEEASKANCIGLMRNGRLLEEGSPEFILNKYEADTLESAFLTVCFSRENNKVICNDEPTTHTKENIKQTPSKQLSKSGQKISFTRIKAIIKKNVKVYSRDFLLLFTMVIIPTIQMFNICFSVGEINGLDIAIKSDEIIFSECNNFSSGCILDEGNNKKISCVIMEYFMSHDYHLIEVNNREAGELLMKQHKSTAFMYFPANYTKDLSNYIGENRDSYNFESPLYIHVSKHNSMFKEKIVKDVYDSLQQMIRKTLTDCSNNPRALAMPMNFHTVVGEEVKTYLNSFVAFFIAMLAFFFPSIFSVSVMLSERMDGILSRSMFSGVTILELLISLFCITTVIIVAQLIIPLITAYMWFTNPIQITSGLFIYILHMIFLGWIGFFFGIIAAGISPTRVGGVYIVNGLCMCQFLLSGFLWPIEGQSLVLRSISKTLPMYIAGNTMNQIALKGWTWNQSSISSGTAMLGTQIILLALALVSLGKIKNNMWVLNR